AFHVPRSLRAPHRRIGAEQAGELAVPHVPVPCPATAFLSRGPGPLDGPHPFAVPQIHRPAVAAELEMARPPHPRQRPRVLPLALTEPPVLPDQGGDVAGRRPPPENDPGGPEHSDQVSEGGRPV